MAGGHRLEDIKGYTIRAIQQFVDILMARKKSELKLLTVAIRHSQGTDPKVFKEFLSSLEDDYEPRCRC